MATPLQTLPILLTLIAVAAATAVQPLLTPSSSAAVTIPAFPEQSDAAGCRLSFPPSFFRGVKSACGNGGEIHRGRCCPALAAWLYSAYSATALGPVQRRPAAAYDMPVLPDDSETCVGEAERAMRQRGIVLRRPNETCDVVYCYCGIRLRSLSCPAAFSSSDDGKLVGDASVKRLERDCLQRSDVADGFPGLGGCSKCLHSLHLLNKKKTLNTSKLEDMRTTKMRNKDCEMMGLTWLLAKNRTAYIHTVSAVIREIMLSPDGVDHHQSCALSSDGMPLAVDSSEISDLSESNGLVPLLQMSISTLVVSLLYMYIIWPFHS